MTVKKLVIASTHAQYNIWLENKNPKEYPCIRSEMMLRGWNQSMPILLIYPDLTTGDTFKDMCAHARAMFDDVKVVHT